MGIPTLPRLVHSAWLGAQSWSGPRSIVESCCVFGMWAPTLAGPSLLSHHALGWAPGQGAQILLGSFSLQVGSRQAPPPQPRDLSKALSMSSRDQNATYFVGEMLAPSTDSCPRWKASSYLNTIPGLPSLCPKAPDVLASCPPGDPAIHYAPHP